MGQLALVRDEVFRRHAIEAALEHAGCASSAATHRFFIAPSLAALCRFQHADGSS
jgi:hypothetical protein